MKHGNTDRRKREKKTKEWKHKAGDFSECPYYKKLTEVSQSPVANMTPNLSTDSSHLAKTTHSTVITDVWEGKDTTRGTDILADVLRNNNNFCSPRRLLSYAIYPEVDRSLTTCKIVSSGVEVINPITVTRLPPQSVLSEIENNPKKTNSSDIAFQFPSYGIFDREGISLGEVSFDKKLEETSPIQSNPVKEGLQKLEFPTGSY